MYPPIIAQPATETDVPGFTRRPVYSPWAGRYLVATSEQEKRELIGGGIDAARVEVRRNGAELPANEPEAGKFRRARGISSDAKVILFHLGRLVSKKSPDLLARGIRELAREFRWGPGCRARAGRAQRKR